MRVQPGISFIGELRAPHTRTKASACSMLLKILPNAGTSSVALSARTECSPSCLYSSYIKDGLFSFTRGKQASFCTASGCTHIAVNSPSAHVLSLCAFVSRVRVSGERRGWGTCFEVGNCEGQGEDESDRDARATETR